MKPPNKNNYPGPGIYDCIQAHIISSSENKLRLKKETWKFLRQAVKIIFLNQRPKGFSIATILPLDQDNSKNRYNQQYRDQTKEIFTTKKKIQ